jgi:beta-glucanase (GH16 family)
MLMAPTVSSPASAVRPYVAAPSCGVAVYKNNGTPWTCTFDDEFAGSALDTSKWVIGVTTQTGFTVGQTCFTANNVVVQNGALNLTARDTGSIFECASPAGSFSTRYTGGDIGTSGRFSQAYGRFEVRAKFPAGGPGVHGGYWLYPAAQTYGAWPASGEIDESEWWSSVPTMVLPTLHYTGSTILDSGAQCLVVNPTLWHTYTLIWTTTQMQFSIDGTTCFTDTPKPTAPMVPPAPFDKPFNMILNMAVDNDPATNNVVGTTTVLPATYAVDYVRAWR